MSTLNEALDHARHGRRVIWLSVNNARAIHDAQVASDIASTCADTEYVARTGGRQSIRFRTGGTIHFLSVKSPDSARGFSADVAYLPHWKYTQDSEFMSRVIGPLLATTTDPRVGVVA
jgi:hypothetical protein